jgi:hypothetical protein
MRARSLQPNYTLVSYLYLERSEGSNFDQIQLFKSLFGRRSRSPNPTEHAKSIHLVPSD